MTEETKADEPRVFALHKYVYGLLERYCAHITDHTPFRSILQMRIAKAQQAQRAKRQAEVAKNPIAFPAVPKGIP
jgi:7-keto-8-aminopelargonate synthetase-like enzyme